MRTHHWAQQLGLQQTETGELIRVLDPAESRARTRRAKEKLQAAPEEVEDADDSSLRKVPCPT